MKKLILAAAHMLAATVLVAATLSVDVDIQTKTTENDRANQRKQIAIFVLDRSGSMTNSPVNGESAPSRNQLLRESIRGRLQSIANTQPDTDIYFIRFSSAVFPQEGPLHVRNDAEVDNIYQMPELQDAACHGMTLLYDAQARAMEFAEELFSKHPSAKIMLFVYTDGANETHRSGHWIVDGRKIDKEVRFPSVNYSMGRWEKEQKEALRKFNEEFGSRIESYVSDGKIEQHWGWLGPGDPPDDLIKPGKDKYYASFDPTALMLKNPACMPEQKCSGKLTLPLPEHCIKRLDGLSVVVTPYVDGQRLSPKPLSLKPGKSSVSFQLPDRYSEGEIEGRLEFSCAPDVGDREELVLPPPVTLKFLEPTSISFKEFNVSVDGKAFPNAIEDIYIRVGSKVSFFASASDNAPISWKSPELKTEKAGPELELPFDKAGDFTIVATAGAKGTGVLPASRTIWVHVIDAKIREITVKTPKPTVGEPVDFEAEVNGSPIGYSWWVDDQQVSGGVKLSGQMMQKSGGHVVKAVAHYGHGISSPPTSKLFDVAVKPRLAIVDPYDGCEFKFDDPILCTAIVEGEFDKVEWMLLGPTTNSVTANVVNGHSDPVAFKRLGRGGRYTLSAVAKGSAGVINSESAVTVDVAREDVAIAIESPGDGKLLKIGKDSDGVVLRAKVKGSTVKQARWEISRRSNGRVLTNIVAVVEKDGFTKPICYRPSAKLKNEEVLSVCAIAELSDGEPPVLSSPVDIIVQIFAKLSIDAVMYADANAGVGREVNGSDVPFASVIRVKATFDGEIDTRTIKWYKIVGDNSAAVDLHKDGVGAFDLERELACGENLRCVKYYAIAKNAGGQDVRSNTISIIYHCPDFKVWIKLPQTNGMDQVEFDLKDKIWVDIAGEKDKLEDLVWYVDGEKVAEGCDQPHCIANLGRGVHSISAKGRCKDCKKPYNLTLKKITAGAVLKAVIKYKEESYYTPWGNIHLDGSGSKGYPEEWHWSIQRDGDTNFVALADSDGELMVDINPPWRPSKFKVRLTVVSPEGTHSCETKELIVRWGLIGALLIIAVAIIVWCAFWKLLYGNEPRNWEVQVAFCTKEDAMTTNDRRLRQMESYASGVSLTESWSMVHKSAKVRVKEIAESDSKGVDWAKLPEESELEFTQSQTARQAYVIGSTPSSSRGTGSQKYFKPVDRPNLPSDMRNRTFVFEKVFGKKTLTGKNLSNSKIAEPKARNDYMIVFVEGVKPNEAMNYFLYNIFPLFLVVAVGLTIWLVSVRGIL